ncbi:hypothetical protein BJQ94_12110 [Cryobacterium sp. SO2]|uniref:hypothetical protein n=1 Tax=Cryobacterium sp. SO2 TaxID=1897060 RepID=UPI00223E6C51|nr:hypothetical protein [Cryobacterium sp. SO2]WEO76116.1 hypothetical protein BJQ94_12110 [Cryobacterium sp. SO2]
MFGRRRRTAPVVQAPVAPALPELSRAQIFEHLHSALADLVGSDGAWTLVPRQAGDTDVIFHGLKAHQIAAALTEILATETIRLRTEETAPPANIAEPRTDTPAEGIAAADIAAANTGAVLVASGAEPTALPWNPAPISVWAEQHDGARAGTSPRLVA